MGISALSKFQSRQVKSLLAARAARLVASPARHCDSSAHTKASSDHNKPRAKAHSVPITLPSTAHCRRNTMESADLREWAATPPHGAMSLDRTFIEGSVGTYSNHGFETSSTANGDQVVQKINQDRGSIEVPLSKPARSGPVHHVRRPFIHNRPSCPASPTLTPPPLCAVPSRVLRPGAVLRL